MSHLKSKMIPTKLNFAPNYPDNMVRVSLGCYSPEERTGKDYYVIVRGQDDKSLQTLGMKLDDAEALYESIKFLDKDSDIDNAFRCPQSNGWPRLLKKDS